MGHVVCIKGISSHFKRWPGFSPPGTPVTHPLVHTPFKEPGTAAPLQPLSTVCVCACIILEDTAQQCDIVSLLSCHSELCTVRDLQKCGGSNLLRPYLRVKYSFFGGTFTACLMHVVSGQTELQGWYSIGSVSVLLWIRFWLDRQGGMLSVSGLMCLRFNCGMGPKLTTIDLQTDLTSLQVN